MSEIITVRDIGTVTTEILMIRNQVNQVALNGAIEIGRRLVEAKSILPHGEWGRWLKEEVDFSQSSAQNFMRIFEEYGDEQITIFGAVSKSQSIGNLPYTKALKLLALPAEEREEFAEAVDAEHISARELEQVIRERNAAKAEANELQSRVDELDALLSDANRELDATEEDIRNARVEGIEAGRKETAAALERMREAETVARAAKERAETAENQTAKLRADLINANEEVKKARADLKAFKAKPEIPKEMMAKLRKEAEEAAAKAEAEKAADKLRKAEDTARAAEEQAKRAQEQYEAAKKQLAISNPDAAVFAALFTELQEDWNRLHGAWIKVSAADPELAERLRTAIHAQITVWQKEVW